jgi:hypothetical protein
MLEYEAGAVSRRSQAVSALGVTNMLLGILRLILSALAIWLLVEFLAEGPAPNPDLLNLLGFLLLIFLWPLLLVIAIVSLGAGLLLIVAGMGVMRRKPWSHTLTLVLAALGGVLAGIYGLQLVGEVTDGAPTLESVGITILGIVVHGGYCIFALAVLLNRRYAAEFAT